ncbi:PfkB family carbohydrate kinase [Sphingobium sp. H39-3-25]|uniref:PfkB family carbohydrate kinase n=1 Tax=Sphingobium arseniciresistens TaxID=3030834 RepID=UPI0023B89AEC|nr:PfkB family carbohydrate kinase [Sphingobium arseniciresistens]
MIRILGLGDNTVDTYVNAGVQYPGGNALNVAVMMSRLGAVCGYLGCVGDDEGGRVLRAALEAEGIDISRMRVRPGANARAYIGHVDGDRHFIKSGPGVRSDYGWEDDDFAYVRSFDHVHTSIYSDLREALARISASAQSLSFDMSDRWDADYLRKVAPHARFLFLSASHLSEDEVHALADICLSYGPEAVVLTRGKYGAFAANASGRILQPALPANVIDTLGAGDGFISGFLTAILAARPLNEAMVNGALFAAQVCGWSGGFGHAAPWTGDPNEI